MGIKPNRFLNLLVPSPEKSYKLLYYSTLWQRKEECMHWIPSPTDLLF